jgi:hypothetical protein
VAFVDLDFYRGIVSDDDALMTFLRGLGVASFPQVVERGALADSPGKRGTPVDRSQRGRV